MADRHRLTAGERYTIGAVAVTELEIELSIEKLKVARDLTVSWACKQPRLSVQQVQDAFTAFHRTCDEEIRDLLDESKELNG